MVCEHGHVSLQHAEIRRWPNRPRVRGVRHRRHDLALPRRLDRGSLLRVGEIARRAGHSRRRRPVPAPAVHDVRVVLPDADSLLRALCADPRAGELAFAHPPRQRQGGFPAREDALRRRLDRRTLRPAADRQRRVAHAVLHRGRCLNRVRPLLAGLAAHAAEEDRCQREPRRDPRARRPRAAQETVVRDLHRVHVSDLHPPLFLLCKPRRVSHPAEVGGHAGEDLARAGVRCHLFSAPAGFPQ